MSKIVLTFIIFLSIFWLGSCSKDERILNWRDKNPWFEFINKGNYSWAIVYFEEAVKKEPSYENKILLANSYLKYANSYSKEDSYTQKSIEILRKLEPNFEVLYNFWYAYEITKNYNKALDYYNAWLKTVKNDNDKAILLNQIWHIYDLMWDYEKANKNYLDAEELNKNLEWVLINRWRYEFRKENYDKALEYFNKVTTSTQNSFTKAEMYYNISNIHLAKNEIDKAVENSQKWIKENSEYPYNHLSLWIAYLQKWWNDIEKAKSSFDEVIKLAPKTSLWYKYKWVYYYLKDDFINAIKNFKKQEENSKVDILLMDDQRKQIELEAIYDIARSYWYLWDENQSISYLKKVLNWENFNFYYGFLNDNWNKNWPFSKFQNSDIFKKFILDTINLYK